MTQNLFFYRLNKTPLIKDVTSKPSPLLCCLLYEEIKCEINRILVYECRCNKIKYFKRREVWECEGWVCDLEAIGDPSIFNWYVKLQPFHHVWRHFIFIFIITTDKARATENTYKWVSVLWKTYCCLLWRDKTRAKYKTYIWVSVWWKTKR
jgi:hypothetical protein